MDFLTTAVYSDQAEDGKNTDLIGVVVTRFDPEDISSRASVEFVDADTLKSGEGLDTRGFYLDSNGILFSDTESRRSLSPTMATYVMKHANQYKASKVGIIDILLMAVRDNACVLVNYDLHADAPERHELISIPAINYKVSESSFNIYAPYTNESGFFRTHSLVDVTQNTAIPFFLAVPDQAVENWGSVMSVLSACDPLEALPNYSIFCVYAELVPTAYFAGEAFINFLAFNVAYHRMGEKIIKSYMRDTRYTPDKESEPKELERKRPLRNISIYCSYNRPKMDEVVKYFGNVAEMEKRMHDGEFRITTEWVLKLLKVIQNVQDTSGAGSESEFQQKTCAACIPVLASCRKQLLHYSLELLGQRLYVADRGPFADPLNLTLKGGGVYGNSIKRTAW